MGGCLLFLLFWQGIAPLGPSGQHNLVMNHGISARIDRKSTLYPAALKIVLKILLFIFSSLTIYTCPNTDPLKSFELVQTHATIGGPYVSIPNGTGVIQGPDRSG
jgi:hypothetical protein